MHCDEAHELIELALDDGAELEGEVLEHVEGCPECRARYESGRELVGRLEREAERILGSAPRVSAESVLEAIGGRASRTRRTYLKLSLAAAAAVLIGLAVALLSPARRARDELTQDEIAALEELRSARDDLLGSLWGGPIGPDVADAFNPLAPGRLLADELDSLGTEVREAEAFLLRLFSLSELVNKG
ncbi:MAG: anti-sigma factor [Planctomycetota bacterium]|jgi:hypothetical protein